MGEVWAGEHVRLKLRIAMKVLHREAHANHEIVARFSREAFLLGQIQSDHVARVYDYVATGRYAPLLVMEFIDGPSLADALGSGPMSVGEAIALGIDLARALRELHSASVIHRDLKPANVMLRPQRDGGHRAVFVDLGVSRLLSEEDPESDDQLTEITSADRCVGTVEYMAPEQILSSRTATPAADVYAAGAILFRAVAGHNAFGDLRGVELMRAKIREAAPALHTGRDDAVGKGFERIVARALSQSPADRFTSADDLLRALCLLREGAASGASSISLSTLPPPAVSQVPSSGVSRVSGVVSRGSTPPPVPRLATPFVSFPKPPRVPTVEHVEVDAGDWLAKDTKRVGPRLRVALALVIAVLIGALTESGVHAVRRDLAARSAFARSVAASPAAVSPVTPIAGDVDQCRIVGQEVDTASPPGVRKMVLSIACPSSGAGRTSIDTTVP
jgi:serine/threonine-protein kinase